MKPTLKFVSLILSLILCVGVTVSCFHAWKNTDDGGSGGGSGSGSGGSGVSFVIPGESDSPPGGGSSSGGSSEPGETPSTTGVDVPPASNDVILWNSSTKTYTISGYTTVPANLVSPSWFNDSLSGGSGTLDGRNVILECIDQDFSGNYSLGYNVIDGSGISFELNTSDCCLLYASLCSVWSGDEESQFNFAPVFCVMNNNLFIYKDIQNRTSHGDSSASYGDPGWWPASDSSELGPWEFDSLEYFTFSPGTYRFLIFLNNGYLYLFVNDVYLLSAPFRAEGGYYISPGINALLNVTVDGEIHDQALFKNVCFYIQ